MIREKKSMEEIHKIMAKLHDARTGMSPEEIVKDIHAGAERVKSKYNLILKKMVQSPDVVVKK